MWIHGGSFVAYFIKKAEKINLAQKIITHTRTYTVIMEATLYHPNVQNQWNITYVLPLILNSAVSYSF